LDRAQDSKEKREKHAKNEATILKTKECTSYEEKKTRNQKKNSK
jgi:hypothetical protein